MNDKLLLALAIGGAAIYSQTRASQGANSATPDGLPTSPPPPSGSGVGASVQDKFGAQTVAPVSATGPTPPPVVTPPKVSGGTAAASLRERFQVSLSTDSVLRNQKYVGTLESDDIGPVIVEGVDERDPSTFLV